MVVLQKSAADATRFRTLVFGTFGPEEAFSAAFDFNVKTQPYVYGQPLEEALNACFERFATVAPTFANAHKIEFTLRFIHETASGNEEVLIARSKDGLSGRLEDLTPWKLQRVEVPEETPCGWLGSAWILNDEPPTKMRKKRTEPSTYERGDHGFNQQF